MKRREITLNPILCLKFSIQKENDGRRVVRERDINMKGRIKATSQVYKKFGLTGDPINKLECQHKQK